MFNALNRFMSRLDGDAPQQRQHDRDGSFGFQALRNSSLELLIEPWFDFIVGINGRPIDNPDAGLFAQEIRNCAGGTVTFWLWSAKGQRTRELHVHVPYDTASLGLTVQYTPLAVATNIWHVLDVPAGSPADHAGLIPYSDYIVGSAEGALHGEGALSELVEDHIGRPLRLYVYNNEYDVSREVTIRPSRGWGGSGAIGCTLGFGALHRLPAPLSEPVSAPGETMFDGEYNEKKAVSFPAAAKATEPGPLAGAGAGAGADAGDFLVPAQMVGVNATAPPPPTVHAPATPRAGKKKERHTMAPNNFMDDYFKEEEQKSRALDNAPAGKGTGVPPPPRAAVGGGPPRAGTHTTSEHEGGQA
ncbi:Uncharacterized protein ESCO_000847 [Escovopsis weberi]|uniref:PDZ GRASP-type domain-containing protein n=1 Tax=Escovopsis weberi TaxID=150374 RepID=A0A0M8MXQ0_ESCWE|nr:Uncharacterized protein ESCO_000847 [Escovopsis weberi]